MNACNVLSTILSLVVLLSPSLQDSHLDGLHGLSSQNRSRFKRHEQVTIVANAFSSASATYTSYTDGTFSFIVLPHSNSTASATRLRRALPERIFYLTNSDGSVSFILSSEISKSPISPKTDTSQPIISNKEQGDENGLSDNSGSPRIQTKFVKEENIILPRQRDENLEDGCVLPEYPEGGSYDLAGCAKPCNKRTGDMVPKMSLLIYSYKDNHILNGSSIFACIDGKWYNPPSYFKICPALRSTSVDINCKYQGEIASCTKLVLPGTRAKLSCKPSYKLPVANDPGYREITCLDNGSWDRYVFRCQPGERY